MGRVNKKIDGVFIDIVGNNISNSTFNEFIANENKKESNELKSLVSMYKRSVDKNKKTFEKLASLEEIIIQKRIRETLNDLKVCLVREYVYVRTPFYRKDKKAKDIRVIMGKLELYPSISEKTVETLLNDPKFVKRAKQKLGEVMDNEINENLKLLKLD